MRHMSVILVSSLLTSLACAATAQEDGAVSNGQQFGEWTVSCEAIAVNRTACVLTQALLRDTDQAFVAQMLAFWSGDGTQSYVAARVPVGAYLPAGFAMRSETSEEVIQFTWQTCTQQFCEAMAALGAEKITELATGEAQIVASYRPGLAVDPIVFSFSMAGAGAGLAALHPDKG